MYPVDSAMQLKYPPRKWSRATGEEAVANVFPMSKRCTILTSEQALPLGEF